MLAGLKSEPFFQRMVDLRRTFHRNPELAFEEVDTACVIMEELEQLDIPYDYMGQGGGVVGYLTNDPSAPTVALRAEMDALPGHEATDLPFASEVEGKMHACGHDAHMAMVLGAAALLKSNPPDGNVLLIFQPAEERGGGARVMMKSGLLKNVRAVFGGHVTHHYHVGEIMVAEGAITAQSDRFVIYVHGKGGHGARPHEAVDAVAICGILINALQLLVSRGVNPVYPTVVTIGRVEAGTAANVIAHQAVLEGTVRTTLPETRAHVHTAMRRMCKAIGEMNTARVEVEIEEGYPPVVNSKRETKLAERAIVNVVGQDGLMTMDHPSMGSEDFSYYLQQFPGCYVRFGARISEREYIPLHSPDFDIDENVLPVGAAFFDEIARIALEEYRENKPL